ncbi:MAG: autotransporter-associated beta strand repeat-containing protein, partial [Patescibacteria group bacterium]|nr:autotransporter-associated beta strand repeat-containing protein [Patescibacteria group bacterium]
QGGIATPAAETITIRGQGHGGSGALRNVSGDNTVNGNVNFALTTPDVRMASDAGTLTIKGSVDMRASDLTVAGAGDMVIEGALYTSNVGTAGLLETVYNVNNANNPTAGTVVAGPTAYLSVRAGETTSAQPWNYVGDNETVVYQGQFYDEDGKFAFAENIDDSVRIFVNGVLVLSNDTWDMPTTTASTTNNAAAGAGVIDFGMGPESDGWHNIEFRFANGGGGAGPVAGSGWTSTYGFGLNNDPLDGFSSNNGADYFAPVDPGNATLFRYNLTSRTTENGLTKTGAGTLTLGGANTYAGTTTVQEGTLLVNGSHVGGGAYTVQSGATLGGTGIIASAVAVNAGGTLSPGMSPGVLTMQSLGLAAGSTTLMEINGLVRGTEYDGVDISAESGLAYGGTLSLAFGNGTWLDAGAVLDLFSFTGAVSGEFTDVVSTGFYTGPWEWDGMDTFSLESGWQTLLFSHATGDLTIVPEPAAWTLMLLALACGLLVRRRR